MNEENALSVFSVLSNATRLRVLKALVTAGDEGLQAGDIAVAVDATPSRASFHLSSMAEAGLVSSKRRSRQIVYSANYEKIGELVKYLLEDCCQNNPSVLSCCVDPGIKQRI